MNVIVVAGVVVVDVDVVLFLLFVQWMSLLLLSLLLLLLLMLLLLLQAIPTGFVYKFNLVVVEWLEAKLDKPLHWLSIVR